MFFQNFRGPEATRSERAKVPLTALQGKLEKLLSKKDFVLMDPSKINYSSASPLRRPATIASLTRYAETHPETSLFHTRAGELFTLKDVLKFVDDDPTASDTDQCVPLSYLKQRYESTLFFLMSNQIWKPNAFQAVSFPQRTQIDELFEQVGEDLKKQKEEMNSFLLNSTMPTWFTYNTEHSEPLNMSDSENPSGIFVLGSKALFHFDNLTFTSAVWSLFAKNYNLLKSSPMLHCFDSRDVPPGLFNGTSATFIPSEDPVSSAALLAALTRDIDDRVPASTHDYIGTPAGAFLAEDTEIKQEIFKLIGELVKSHEALA